MQVENESEINGGINILSLAAKTLLYFMAIVSLLTACIFFCNPFYAMKKSYELGYEKNAYEYARVFLKREARGREVTEFDYNGKYVSALIYSMELGEKLLGRDNAARVKTETEIYSSIKDIEKRNELLDAYYRKVQPAMQVAVYSYENYVSSLHARACALLANAGEVFIVDKAAITAEEAALRVAQLDLSQREGLTDFAILLNQASVFIEEEAETEQVVLAIELRLSEFVASALSYATDDLFRLFLVRSAVGITELKKSEGGVWSQEVDEASLTDYYYTVLLNNYINR